MKCPKCGNEQETGAFCTECGSPMNQERTPAAQQSNAYGYGSSVPNNQVPKKEPFYTKTWLIVIACLFLPPIGIILMWIAKKPKKMILRIILTVILALYTIGSVTNKTSENSTEQTTDSTVTQETTNNIDTSNSQNTEASDSQEVSEAQEETTITPDEYKSQCQEVSYNDIMRNPDQYIGQKFKITAKIIVASQKWSTGTYYKAYTDDGSGMYLDKMVWIFDKRDENANDYIKLLEGDTVTFYGEFNGLQSTRNALNGENGEDFSLDAYYVDIVEEAK